MFGDQVVLSSTVLRIRICPASHTQSGTRLKIAELFVFPTFPPRSGVLSLIWMLCFVRGIVTAGEPEPAAAELRIHGDGSSSINRLGLSVSRHPCPSFHSRKTASMITWVLQFKSMSMHLIQWLLSCEEDAGTHWEFVLYIVCSPKLPSPAIPVVLISSIAVLRFLPFYFHTSRSGSWWRLF